jgi:site-specific DNA-cytosine methylase
MCYLKCRCGHAKQPMVDLPDLRSLLPPATNRNNTVQKQSQGTQRKPLTLNLPDIHIPEQCPSQQGAQQSQQKERRKPARPRQNIITASEERIKLPFQKATALNYMEHVLRVLLAKGKGIQLSQVAGAGAVCLGSLCSGMDMFIMVAVGFLLAWEKVRCESTGSAAAMPSFRLKHACSCEMHDGKRKLLHEGHASSHPAVLGLHKPEHIYKDIVKLAAKLEVDEVTGIICQPDHVDFVFSGWSCKDLSGLRSQTVAFAHNNDDSASSAKTFYATVECVKSWRPSLVAFENVKNVYYKRKVDQDGTPPIEHIKEVMRQTGYICADVLANSRDYGLPQSRPRCYMMFFQIGLGDTLEAKNLFLSFRCRHLHLAPHLAPEKSDAELLDDMPDGHGQTPHHECVGQSANGTKRSKKKTKSKQQRPQRKWIGHTAAMVKKHKVTKPMLKKERDLLATNSNFKACSERSQHLLVTTHALMRKRGIDPMRSPLVVQIDQGVQRCPIGIDFIPCLVPKGVYWLSQQACLLNVCHCHLCMYVSVSSVSIMINNVIM